MIDYSKIYPDLKQIRQLKSNCIPLFFPECVIYFLFNNGKLVYIGQTKHLLKRIKTHLKRKIFNEIAIIETNNEDILKVESYYINKYTPPYNITNKMKSDRRKGHKAKGFRY